MTQNLKRGTTKKSQGITNTKLIKHREGLSKKNLLDIINDQSSKVIHLNQIIEEIKHNNDTIFHGNCDPDMTIHSHNTASTESEVSQ